MLKQALIAPSAITPNRALIFIDLRQAFCFPSEILTSQRDQAKMYRCYFTQAGQIAQGCWLKVETLDAAIATARKILADHLEIDTCDGLEIWLDQALLYRFFD